MLRQVLLRLLFWVVGMYILFFFPVALTNGQEILPLNQVKVGDKGYGLTVFKGTEPEKFEFKVLGVFNSVDPIGWGRKEIMIEIYGGPKYENGKEILSEAGISGGMSGSPIFIDNKVAGAIAESEEFSKKSWAYAVPIEQIIDFKLKTLDILNKLIQGGNGFIRTSDVPKNFTLRPGDQYYYCEVWGDEYLCDGATVIMRDPKNPTTLYLMAHKGDTRTGITFLPFGKEDVFGVEANLKSSIKIGQPIGPMLGSLIFNGPFGQIGKLGMLPVPLSLTIALNDNFKSGNRTNHYFLAYTKNTGVRIGEILKGKSQLVDGFNDIYLEAKLNMGVLGTVCIRGKLDDPKSVSILADAFIGRDFNPFVRDAEISLTAKPKFKILKLKKVSIEHGITQLLFNGEQEWHFGFKLDRKDRGENLSLASGDEIVEQLLSGGAIPNRELVNLLNQISNRNSLYLYSLTDMAKGRCKKTENVWITKSALNLKIIAKLNPPAGNYVLRGKAKLRAKDNESQNKKRFLLF